MRGVLQISKRGGLEFPPQFSREEILFFPISVSAEVGDGDEWEFSISHKKPIGNDRNGTPMFVCSIVLEKRIETITVLNFQTLIVDCGKNSKEIPAEGVEITVKQEDGGVFLFGKNSRSSWKKITWEKDFSHLPVFQELLQKREKLKKLREKFPDKIERIFDDEFDFFVRGVKMKTTHSESSGFWSSEVPNLEVIGWETINEDDLIVQPKVSREFGIVEIDGKKDKWIGGELTIGGEKVLKVKKEIDEKKVLMDRLDQLVEKFIFTRDDRDLEELMQLAGVLGIDGKSLIAKKIESEE